MRENTQARTSTNRNTFFFSKEKVRFPLSEFNMQYRHIHWCKAAPHPQWGKNCYATHFACFIPQPSTIPPHRWKCGFEDHWTLNLPNTSQLRKHLCMVTLCGATMKTQGSIAHNTSHLYSQLYALLWFTRNILPKCPHFQTLFLRNGMEDLQKAFSNILWLKYARGHADQGRAWKPRECPSSITFGCSEYVYNNSLFITKQTIRP